MAEKTLDDVDRQVSWVVRNIIIFLELELEYIRQAKLNKGLR